MVEVDNPKGTILLIDDLPENLQLLSDLLIDMGYTVRSVTSGRMALKTLKVKKPDVILLDIKMPEMDGYQVCEAIKKDENLRDIPVIFISALDDTFDKVKAFKCGGVDYITKPFEIEEVVARLENQLTIQRQKKVLETELKKRREAEEVLYQSRALLASVLNTALDGIAALQAVRNPENGDIEDFRCLIVNPVISRAVDKSREDLIGKLILKRFLYRINPDLFDRFVQVVETGESLADDFYYPFGESSWYHFVAVRLGDGFAITVRDITLRKKMEIELQEANRQLKLLANLDGLTNIANRRCFDEFLVKEWQRLRRTQKPLSLLLFDVDYFKPYNDFYGHQQGDDCLIQIAQKIDKIISRSADLVARYGGEEFVVILPETDREGAIAVAEKIHKVIQELQIPHQPSTVSDYVTISIGISCLIPVDNLSSQDLITQADEALYLAKTQGRDRYWIQPVTQP